MIFTKLLNVIFLGRHHSSTPPSDLRRSFHHGEDQANDQGEGNQPHQSHQHPRTTRRRVANFKRVLENICGGTDGQQ